MYLSDEGVYMNANGGRIKDVRLQWGEVPSSIGNQSSIAVCPAHIYIVWISLSPGQLI